MNAVTTAIVFIISLEYFSSIFYVKCCSHGELAMCKKYSPCWCSKEQQEFGCKLICRKLHNSAELFFNSGMDHHNITYSGVAFTDIEITGSNLLKINATHMKNFEATKVLNFSYNKLNNIAHDTFSGLVDLESLDMSHNNLSDVPIGLFWNLTKLKHLNLAGNQIQNINSSCLRDLRVLIELNLSRNNLREVPEDLLHNMCNLKVVSFAYNKLHILPDKFFKSSSGLETLDLSNNQLSRLQPPLFEPLKNLHHLSIGYNQLKTLENETFVHARKTLNYFDLNGNLWTCGESHFWLYLWLEANQTIFESYDNLFCFYDDVQNFENRSFYIDFETIRMTRTIKECDICKKCKCEVKNNSFAVVVNCNNKNLTLLPQTLPYRTRVVYADNNKIESFEIEEESIHSWSDVLVLGLNNNVISSLQTLEEMPFLKQLNELYISGNKLREIPIHLLDQFNTSFNLIYLGNNPWICNCNTIKFQIWLQNHSNQVKDLKNVRCAEDDTYISNQVISKLMMSELCPQPSQPIAYLNILNIILGLLILFIISKVTYDYWYQKKTGKLPHFFAFNF